jgi:hypothetical protein
MRRIHAAEVLAASMPLGYPGKDDVSEMKAA